MNNRTKIGSVARVSILLSILIALSGMAAIALADNPDMSPPPNWFSGDNVTLNGALAPAGTVINAFIDGEPKGSIVVGSPGKYEYLAVNGSTSDDGKNVTFKVCGANAEPNGTWIAWSEQGVQMLDLTAVDNVAPAVTDANANPTSIVADGVETTQLNVTVIDGCTVDTVTVNLSAIGGDAAQAMTCTGDTDVYAVPVTVAEGTAPGAYCLYVNASDVFENYNTSVCIDLVIKDIEAPVVTNPDANPASIVADGTQESQLNVTVVDDSDIDFVTVNLSAIGGLEAQEMTRIGDTDVYSVTVTAAEGTAGAHCLYINASDVFGNYDDTSVCIVLEVTAELCGDTNGDGQVDMDELFAAIDAYIADPTDMDELFCVIDAYIATA